MHSKMVQNISVVGWTVIRRGLGRVLIAAHLDVLADAALVILHRRAALLVVRVANMIRQTDIVGRLDALALRQALMLIDLGVH